MRIAVVGAGGHDVTIVARGRHLAAIQTRGLRVRSAHGNLHVPAASAVPAIGDVGRAAGVQLAPDFTEDGLAFCDGLPPAMTSSMHNDRRPRLQSHGTEHLAVMQTWCSSRTRGQNRVARSVRALWRI